MKSAPTCSRCGGTDLAPPAPLRTSAHPNSSFLLVETPGAHFHDFAVQGTVCLSCGAVQLSLSAPTLEAFRAAGKEPPAGKRSAGRRSKGRRRAR